jgi:hypothetical protein
MIKRIFQDLDECILHTRVNDMPDDGDEYVEFVLGEDTHTYRTVVRPCAKSLFEYYNSVVGKENVYILTAATRDYAKELNRVCEFGLDDDHIYAREDTDAQRTRMGWGGSSHERFSIADKKNVLIDNLHLRYNNVKIQVTGIHDENYHQTPAYYGNNNYESGFLKDIKAFIEKRR